MKDATPKTSNCIISSQKISLPSQNQSSPIQRSKAAERPLPAIDDAIRNRLMIVAPMVKASDLAFRLLCRRYGADVCFTPMFYSHLFADSQAYRAEVFQTTPEDRPLVVQFAGCDKDILLRAARHIEQQCDAIDLNLGCPLREGKVLGFGSWLLEDPESRDRVVDVVRHLAAHLSIPVFCKIRLLPDPNDTLAFALRLEAAGAALITLHARTRGSPKQRRYGPAYLSFVKLVCVYTYDNQ